MDDIIAAAVYARWEWSPLLTLKWNFFNGTKKIFNRKMRTGVPAEQEKNLECVSLLCVFFLLKRLKQKLSSNSKNSFFLYFCFHIFREWSRRGILCLQVDLIFYIYRHISEFQTEIRGIRIPKRSLFRAKISLFPLLIHSFEHMLLLLL